MGMLTEFKELAVKGNVADMGVGIVIGAAFTSIVNSFVTDILNPVLGLVIRPINRLKADEETPAGPPAPPRSEAPLEEIRDVLANGR